MNTAVLIVDGETVETTFLINGKEFVSKFRPKNLKKAGKNDRIRKKKNPT